MTVVDEWLGTITYPNGTVCSVRLVIDNSGTKWETCNGHVSSIMSYNLIESPPYHTQVTLRNTVYNRLDLHLVGDGNTLAGTRFYQQQREWWPDGVAVAFTRRVPR
jgi:hypothetical protein